ncbi:transglycosylase SLT domain-containing protein [Francisellaceae bacterium]|nr:transglycosylase SLT domain-containing protein [Francisellaceae bacterium]
MKLSFSIITFLSFIGLLAGCSSSVDLEGVNIQNGCQIIQKVPKWGKDLHNVQKKWGVPPSLVLAIIFQESSFNPDAKNSTSSAYGYAQVINGTWTEYKKAVDKDASRSDFDDSADFIGWYLNRIKNKYKLAWSNSANLYMAYMLGESGYKKFITGNGSEQQKQSWAAKYKIAQKVAANAETYKKQMLECKS